MNEERTYPGFYPSKKTVAIFVFILLMGTLISCQKKEKNMDYIQQEMVRLGYDGKIERPSGTFEKAAMGLLGVEEVIAYNKGTESFAVIMFKNASEEDLRNRMQKIMSFIELYVAGDDYDKLSKSKELIESQSIMHNNMMVVWHYEKPDDIIKLIRKHF